jgi:hypothetical protein
MGKQVNFYMYGSDEELFLSSARKHGDLYVLPDTSPTEVFEPLLELPGKDQLGWFHLWLWNGSICRPPIVRWIEQQSHYVIDPSPSEVIELSRSYESEGSLVRGRLWAELTGWRKEAPAEIFEKSLAFRKWFNSLASWIKRHYTRMPDGWYAGPGAAEFQRRGGRLIQANFASVVKIVRH